MDATNEATKGNQSSRDQSWNASEGSPLTRGEKAQINDGAAGSNSPTATHWGASQRPVASALAWFDRWIEKPCTIPSPLNEI